MGNHPLHLQPTRHLDPQLLEASGLQDNCQGSVAVSQVCCPPSTHSLKLPLISAPCLCPKEPPLTRWPVSQMPCSPGTQPGWPLRSSQRLSLEQSNVGDGRRGALSLQWQFPGKNSHSILLHSCPKAPWVLFLLPFIPSALP